MIAVGKNSPEMEEVALQDWPGPPVDISGNNSWMPAYGFQTPSALLEKDDFIGNPGISKNSLSILFLSVYVSLKRLSYLYTQLEIKGCYQQFFSQVVERTSSGLLLHILLWITIPSNFSVHYIIIYFTAYLVLTLYFSRFPHKHVVKE